MRDKITFSDIKLISESLQRGQNKAFIDYLNSFEGKDIYKKFINILKLWETDVTYTLSFNISEVSDRPTKIQLAYIISQLQELSENIKIVSDNVELVIGIPSEFELTEGFPIYSILKYINISGIFINLSDLPFHDRKNIIDSLPANIYNIIINNISPLKDFVFGVDHPALQHFKLNFLSNDPMMFIKGLFESFDEMYFREVIYYLSRKIDGSILLASTPQDIEYYIDKMSREANPDVIPGVNL